MIKKLSFNHKDQKSEKLYSDSWEHIQDCLRLLDMRIHAQVVRHRSEQNDGTAQFRGLAVSDAEVDLLLEGGQASPKDLHRLNELMDEIAADEAVVLARADQSAKKGVYLPLYVLSQVCGLSDFELQCVIISLAVEIDRKYETLFAYLNDDITKKSPTISLAMKLLGLSTPDIEAVSTYFEPNSPLYHYVLTLQEDRHDEKTSLVSQTLRLDARIRDFVLGSTHLDDRLTRFTEIVNPDEAREQIPLPTGDQGAIWRFLETQLRFGDNDEKHVICYLSGPVGSGRKTQVKNICSALQRVLMVVDIEKMIYSERSFQQNIELLEREAVLYNALLCFDNFDILLNEDERYYKSLLLFVSALRTAFRVTFLTGRRRWKPKGLLDGHIFVDIEFNIPGESERRCLWESLGQNYKYTSEINWGEFAGKFRFTAGQIKNALTAGYNLSMYRHSGEPLVDPGDIYRACYDQAGHHLEKKAAKIIPRYTMTDIILPPEGKQLLFDISNQVKYKHIVYGDWGFDKKLAYGKGLSAVFSGPPGTGKTMAAQIIAGELSLEIYKIDISQVMSKYIGETEKNLQEIFDEAELSNAILFFDEADALFGKRSEVKDARDRYANVETAYLLQKMEEYSGMTILATNLIGNIDDAFMRRIQFMVEFPFPNAEYREKIWRTIFPQEAPLDDDIDFEFLAGKFEISGGNIKNIAVSSAFFAAEQAKRIGMEHIIKAARYEFKKIGKIFLKEDFGEYYFS